MKIPNLPKNLLSGSLLLTFATLLIGCPSPDNDPEPIIKNYYVNGDPMNFVKGSSFDKSGLPLNLIGKGTLYKVESLLNIKKIEFTQSDIENAHEKVIERNTPRKSTTENESKNSNSKDSDSISPQFSFEQTSQADSSYILSAEGMSNKNGYLFKKEGSKLVLSGIRFDFRDVSTVPNYFEALHYSIKPDGSAFSLLVMVTEEFKDNEASNIYAIYFSKVEEKAEARDPSFFKRTYNFIFGKNADYKWNQSKEFKLHHCGLVPSLLEKEAQSSFNQWKVALYGRLNMGYQMSATCPPFSDLNTQTLRYVDDWIETPGRSATYGKTFIVPNTFRKDFVDSDIFIFPRDTEELILHQHNKQVDFFDLALNSNFASFVGETLTHEIGHTLGLHHIFDGTVSIMSYENEPENGRLTDYDKEWIQALYPKLSN